MNKASANGFMADNRPRPTKFELLQHAGGVSERSLRRLTSTFAGPLENANPVNAAKSGFYL